MMKEAISGTKPSSLTDDERSYLWHQAKQLNR
jgi:hypothetical protein